ncbi:MAG: hypothetical protein P4M13_06640 [Alphaproteobacteria bacterium]|nr:hypothetical protein [Alphaproteobacteria bacterium]
MKQIVAILALMLGVSGCAASDIPEAKATTGRNPTVAEVPDKDETVRGDNDPAIVTLDLSSSLRERRLTATDALPGNIIIPTTNLNAVPVTAALQAVLSGTDVALSWNASTFGTRLVTVMNLSGPLPQVVNKICSAAKVFCDYRHGSLELSEKETFIVDLPPIVRQIANSSATFSSTGASGGSSGGTSQSSGSASNSMVETINGLLDGDKSHADDQGQNIVYTANVDAEDRVSQYLTQLRNGRPLVVLQMYIWEVTLNSENAQGINWSQLSNDTILNSHKSLTLSATNDLTSAATGVGSVSLGAVTSGIISANAIASFIATKGRVQTISNPQITFVSGSTAQLKVGGTQNYISQVGTVVGSNISGTANGSSSATSSTNTNTVTTASIDTGLAINVAGSYENGVVFANLNMSLVNLVSLNPTSSSGGTIDLPQTTKETMDTALRVRPGDSLVLAGLVTSNDSSTGQGLPVGDGGVPLYGDTTLQNHELVIIVKPSVVLFSDKPAEKDAQKKEKPLPLPDAVVIDKSGSHALALPQPKPVAAKPELMLNDPQAASMQNVPVANSDDGAPVDKQLMQRGFSHAFDQLLQSPSAGGRE